jgi:hypothetical protein
VKFGNLQSLVRLYLYDCGQLGCLPDSIVDLSKLKTFHLYKCSKLENLPVKFRDFQSFVELHLSSCSELGCLPDSIVDLSKLHTFHLGGAPNWKIYQWSSGTFKAWWNSICLVVSSWGVYLIQFWTCQNSKHFICGGAPNWRIYQRSLGSFKAWWNSICLVVPSWGVYMIQLWTCHNSIHLICRFGELQSLVELDLSDCSKLGCVLYSIVNRI